MNHFDIIDRVKQHEKRQNKHGGKQILYYKLMHASNRTDKRMIKPHIITNKYVQNEKERNKITENKAKTASVTHTIHISGRFYIRRKY